MARNIGISEARRLLPSIVETIAREGGRIDITHRGEPRVSIVRTEDLEHATHEDRSFVLAPPDGFRVELNVPAADLVEVVRELRSRTADHPAP